MTEEFRHGAEFDRLEAWIDGTYAGEITYSLDGDVVTFDQTYVDPAFRSTGVTGRMLRHVFEEARATGSRVRPIDPFVQSWVRLNPEFQDLIA